MTVIIVIISHHFLFMFLCVLSVTTAFVLKVIREFAFENFAKNAISVGFLVDLFLYQHSPEVYLP